jgi:Flp pilus assembly CpaE family ATPase
VLLVLPLLLLQELLLRALLRLLSQLLLLPAPAHTSNDTRVGVSASSKSPTGVRGTT